MNTTDDRRTATGVKPPSARSSTVSGRSALSASGASPSPSSIGWNPRVVPGSSGPWRIRVSALSDETDPTSKACAYSEREPTGGDTATVRVRSA